MGSFLVSSWRAVPRAVLAVTVALSALVVVTALGTTGAAAQSSNCGATVPNLLNGGFEAPSIGANNTKIQATPVPGLEWANSAENFVELWSSSFYGYSAFEGSQFAELNAYKAGTLYQDLATLPGTEMVFSIAHKARQRDGETMVVRAGPPNGPLTELGRFRANLNGPGRNGWTPHTGRYKVPGGQTTTRFAFESDGSTTIDSSTGNFLDAIVFTLEAGACDDTATGSFGSVTDVAVLTNDIGTGLTITSVGPVSPPEAGSAQITGDRVRFTPAQWSGIATVPYTIRDATGVTSSATVRVTVNPIPFDDTYTVVEDRPQSLVVMANDAVANGRITITTPATSGTATVTPDGQRVAYTPAAGFSGTVTFTYRVTADPNSAVSRDATVTINVDQNSDVEISQGPLPTRIGIDQVFSYPVTVTNNGPATALAPTVTFTLPPDTVLVGGPGCTGGPPATCSISSLPVGGSYTFSPQFRRSSVGSNLAIVAAVSITNSDPIPANNTVTQTFSVEAAADLAVVNPTVTSTPVSQGAPIAYEVGIVNTGPSTATTTSVRLTLIPEADLLSPSVTVAGGPACTSLGGGVYDCPLGDLPPTAGATRTVVVTATIRSGAVVSGVQIGAAVSSAVFDPDPTDNSAVVGATLQPDADLAVTGTLSSAPLQPGGAALFAFTVTNNGPTDASNVYLTLDVPAGLTVDPVGLPAGCSAFVGQILCDVGNLPAGTTWRGGPQVVTAAVSTTAPSTVDVTAQVSGALPDSVPANNLATVAAPVNRAADRGVLIGGASTAVAGQADTVTVSVRNNGPSDAPGTKVDIVLPPSPAFVIASLPAGCSGVPDRFTCTLDLPPGATTNLVLSGTWAATALGTQTFTATIQPPAPTDPPDPVSGNDQATLVTGVAERADLAVTGTVTPKPLAPGSSAFYSLSVANNGPSGVVAGSQLTLTLPLGLTAASSGPCSASASTVTCTLGAIASGASVGTVIEVTAAASLPGTLTATATVTAPATVTETFVPNNQVEITDQAFPSADLIVVPVTTPIEAVPGASAAPSFTLRNLGPSTVPDTPVLVTIPTGYTFVSATGASCAPTATPTEILCAGGPLAVGADETITLTLDVPAGVTGSTSVSATALDGFPGQPPIFKETNTSDNGAIVAVTMKPAADLSVTKTASPNPVPAGTTLTYTIGYANAGPSDATGVVITDTLPTGATFLSAQPGSCTLAGGTVTCALGTVAAGGSGTVTIVVSVPADSAVASLDNRAVITSAVTDPVPDNDSAAVGTAVGAAADVAVTKTAAPGTVSAGGQVTFAVSVSNAGPSVAGGVVVTDAMPAGLTARTASSANASCTVGATVTCSISSLGVGASARIEIVADVGAGAVGTITNTVVVSSATADPTATNNRATATVVVSPPPTTVPPTTVPPGTLPDTGADVAPATTLAVALVVAGLAVVVVVRRRRPANQG